MNCISPPSKNGSASCSLRLNYRAWLYRRAIRANPRLPAAAAANISRIGTNGGVAILFGGALMQAEIVADISRSTLNIAALPGAVRLTWTTNAPGFALETNGNLATAWGVLTTNYSIIETNYAVTNTVDSATRFYRLHKP